MDGRVGRRPCYRGGFKAVGAVAVESIEYQDSRKKTLAFFCMLYYVMLDQGC